MNALRFDETSGLHLVDIDVPRPNGEALVKVSLAGICSTDIQITRGYAGFSGTLGHEFVGIVESSPHRNQIGQRVVGEINAGCRVCDRCLQGDARHCLKRTVLGIHGRDGALADYLMLPAGNLLEVPDTVSDRDAVFCEPLAAACQILDQVTIEPTDRVAVIGDGKLGQLIARVLATTSSNLILIGKHKEKLELARAVGIKTDVSGEPRSFDYVIEASGSPRGLSCAIELVRAQGTIILKSTFHEEVKLESWRIVVDEIRLIGSRCGRFAPALELLSIGRVKPAGLISAEFPLSQGLRAMELAATPGTLKVLVTPDM